MEYLGNYITTQLSSRILLFTYLLLSYKTYFFCFFSLSGVGGVWVQLLGGQEGCTCVILVLRECIWNVTGVLFVIPASDDTGCLGFPPHRMVYPPGSTLGD